MFDPFLANVSIYFNAFQCSLVKGHHEHRILSTKRPRRLINFETLSCGA